MSHKITLTIVAVGFMNAGASSAAETHEATVYDFTVGSGLATMPKYEGSNETEHRILPVVAAYYHSRLGKVSLGTTGLVSGVAWAPIDSDHFEAGFTAGVSRARRESDSTHLRGLGDIDRTPEIGAYGIYKQGNLHVRVSGANALGTKGHTGAEVKTSASYRIQPFDHVSVSTDAGLTWASSAYMKSFFGVTPQQANASSLPVYEARAGLKDTRLGAVISYSLSDHWTIQTRFAVSRLAGDVATSPIVQQTVQKTAVLSLAYRWSSEL